MKPYDPKTDYCGPGKGWLNYLITNKPWGANINRCCYGHDAAYETGGTEEDRERADQAMRDCIYKRLVAKWWIWPRFAMLVANRHYVFVRAFGWTRFTYRGETVVRTDGLET